MELKTKQNKNTMISLFCPETFTLCLYIFQLLDETNMLLIHSSHLVRLSMLFNKPSQTQMHQTTTILLGLHNVQLDI